MDGYTFGDLVAAMLAASVFSSVGVVVVMDALDRRRRLHAIRRHIRWREQMRQRFGGVVREYQATLVRMRARLRLLGADPDAGEDDHGAWLA